MNKILQILLEPHEVQEGSPLAERNQEVEVAGLAAFSSR